MNNCTLLSRSHSSLCCSSGHAHLTDFNIATIIKDGERATALAGTKPYMGKTHPLIYKIPNSSGAFISAALHLLKREIIINCFLFYIFSHQSRNDISASATFQWWSLLKIHN